MDIGAEAEDEDEMSDDGPNGSKRYLESRKERRRNRNEAVNARKAYREAQAVKIDPRAGVEICLSQLGHRKNWTSEQRDVDDELGVRTISPISKLD